MTTNDNSMANVQFSNARNARNPFRHSAIGHWNLIRHLSFVIRHRKVSVNKLNTIVARSSQPDAPPAPSSSPSPRFAPPLFLSASPLVPAPRGPAGNSHPSSASIALLLCLLPYFQNIKPRGLTGRYAIALLLSSPSSSLPPSPTPTAGSPFPARRFKAPAV